MKSLRHLSRGIKKFERTLLNDEASKIQYLGARSTFARSKEKFIRGQNQEIIIPSPFGAVTYPDSKISEYIWRNVNKFSKLIALECGITGRKYTYGQTRDAANYIARSLRNLKFMEGDIIALIAPNFPEWVLAFCGILEAGLIVTTINPHYTVEEMTMQLTLSGAKGIVTAKGILPIVKKAATNHRLGSSLIVIDDGTPGPMADGVIPFKDLITRGKNLPGLKALSSSADDVAVLPFSSGTTGLPKGVMLTHANLVSNIEMVNAIVDKDTWIQMATDEYQDVIPIFLPLFHIFGMNGVMLPSLMVGAKIVTLPKFQPETFFDTFIKQKPAILFCVPPIILFLAVSPLAKREHLSNVRSAFSGAAPLSKEDVDRFYDKFRLDNSSFKFCQGYGLTECAPVAFVEKTGLKYASIGKNICGCDVRLVDTITNVDICEPGRNGELWIRGPHVMKGYFNNPEATKEMLLEDGWLKTGDIAYFDDDLDFYITDRLKELIKVKGFQVPPAELESVLRTHPDVEECAVVGISDARSGEVPRAFVILKKNRKVSEEDIKNFVKGKVSEYKQLDGGVSFVRDIPKNPTGKILRTKIKEAYLKGNL
ncbi:probable 4-coumarate--CoA ligase 1 isoform X1 [Vespa velutina]|nr:probable 4-coumarate--CoA ligase 1 isoform X1 [Vespa velutina]XP_047358393.1 probable 4-coumarate--CoA ligase 1 isoform X1 [Vespa velutina]XP_047358394.1 probable 4-coumarate--CoA ligase 1 isoform X1 [Vespa velutina]XP_047358395.1 probable 4-coumarate--CoA ligase 1 isoform X1 [Vespa velutina]XP_047358396.1 probable 4-coumarate--CoA ligase 1 isoform X1 [Vespa velutina]